MAHILSVRLDIDVTGFTDSSHQFQLHIIYYNHGYVLVNIAFTLWVFLDTGWLTLNSLSAMDSCDHPLKN
jgi:hypothetical protein